MIFGIENSEYVGLYLMYREVSRPGPDGIEGGGSGVKKKKETIATRGRSFQWQRLIQLERSGGGPIRLACNVRSGHEKNGMGEKTKNGAPNSTAAAHPLSKKNRKWMQ